ncbi:MAG: endonuclease/exonuclease/phosphatase family protein [Nanoarchaeota archaeon]|nr:endonuclease/exonuclease/phosphatase family protein [Nanoarchaeota archaeon]
MVEVSWGVQGVRILTYNILTGGSNGRLSMIQDVVRAVDPDVVCLQEANGFSADNDWLLQECGRQLEYPYYALAGCGTAGKDYSVVTYAHVPVLSESLPGFRHAGLLTHFDSWVLCNVLLSDKSDDERLKELSTLVKRCEGLNVVLVGDHNMLSPFDEYDPALPLTFNEKQSARFVRDGKLDFRAARFLARSQYKDVAQVLSQKQEWTVRTPMSQTLAHPLQARLDYVFVAAQLVPYVKSLEVLRNEKTAVASDHYPLVFDIDV